MTNDEIQELRKEIDQIDKKIVEQLATRLMFAKKIASEKKKLGMEVEDAGREEELLDRIRDLADEYGVESTHAQELYLLILAESKRIQEDHQEESS